MENSLAGFAFDKKCYCTTHYTHAFALRIGNVSRLQSNNGALRDGNAESAFGFCFREYDCASCNNYMCFTAIDFCENMLADWLAGNRLSPFPI